MYGRTIGGRPPGSQDHPDPLAGFREALDSLEPIAESDARLRRVLERWDDGSHGPQQAVTHAMVQAYLDGVGVPWRPGGSPGKYLCFIDESNTVFLHTQAKTALACVETIAAAERRHVALVLCDLLPRGWGLP